MDDRGYLITHPELIEPSDKGPPEEKHITHKEPLIANDILNHRGFVHKKVCSSFGDRTVQRYYQVNSVIATYCIVFSVFILFRHGISFKYNILLF